MVTKTWVTVSKAFSSKTGFNKVVLHDFKLQFGHVWIRDLSEDVCGHFSNMFKVFKLEETWEKKTFSKLLARKPNFDMIIWLFRVARVLRRFRIVSN